MGILHSEEVNKLTLIRELMDMGESWINATDLSEHIGISVFSTRELMKKISEDFKRYGINMHLQMLKQRGIQLRNCSYENFFAFKGKLFSKTLEYSLIFDFLFQNAENYANYCEKVFISLPTLRRRLIELNLSLKLYNVHLYKNSIEGEERYVRSFLTQYFYDIHGSTHWPFSSIEKDRVCMLIDHFEHKLNFTLVEDSKEFLCYLWSVSQIRRERNHYLERPLKECTEFCQNNRYYHMFKTVFSSLIANNLYFEFEMEYMFYSFFAMNIDYRSMSPLKTEELGKQYLKQDCKYTLLAHRLITTLELKLYTENLSTDRDVLQMEIYSSCQYAWMFPIKVRLDSIKNFNGYIIDIKNKYPKLLEIIESFKEQIPNDNDFDHEFVLEYLAMVIHAYKNLAHFGKKVKISVCSSLGSIHENVLAAFIMHRFKTEYNIEFVSLNNSPDIIVTDTQLIPNISKILLLQNHILETKDYVKLEMWLSSFDVDNSKYLNV